MLQQILTPGLKRFPGVSCLNLRLSVEIGTAQVSGSNEYSLLYTVIRDTKEKKKRKASLIYLISVQSFNSSLANTTTL